MSWKKFLFPAELRLLSVRRRDGALEVTDHAIADPKRKRAFIGVRPFELAAMAMQDTVFLSGPYRDPYYEAERRSLFLVAVNCTNPAGTCFCTSMNTGPGATAGYDICLTELLEGERHVFLAETGSERAVELLKLIPSKEASETDIASARSKTEQAAQAVARTLEIEGLPQFLKSGIDHPRWDNVAHREKARKASDEQSDSFERLTKLLAAGGSAVGVGATVAAVGKFSQRALALADVHANLRISIDGAKAASNGLISSYELATNANVAMGFGVVKTRPSSLGTSRSRRSSHARPASTAPSPCRTSRRR